MTSISAAVAAWRPAYIDVAIPALLIYDYLLTLDSEICLVWPAPWGLAKVLFLLTRYLPRIDATVILYYSVAPALSPDSCALAYNITGWMFVFDMAIAELIMSLRTWAIWERDRKLGVGMATAFVCIAVAICILFSRFLDSLMFGRAPSTVLVGCLLTGGNHMLAAVYFLVTVFETALFILTLLKGVKINYTPSTEQSSVLVKLKSRIMFRYDGASSVASTLYKDGIRYYFCLFILSIINIVVLLAVPPVYSIGILSPLQRAMHSLLAAHIILHLREANAQTANKSIFSLDCGISELPVSNVYPKAL